jgi:hypothetical protein
MEEGREESLFRDIMGDEDYASANVSCETSVHREEGLTGSTAQHWRYREHYPESIGIYSVQAASREPVRWSLPSRQGSTYATI